MACSEIDDSSTLFGTLNAEALEEKAKKMGAFALSAATAGNTIVVFTMLVLQEILEQLLINPIANLTSITQIATSIAILNNSIKIIP